MSCFNIVFSQKCSFSRLGVLIEISQPLVALSRWNFHY